MKTDGLFITSKSQRAELWLRDLWRNCAGWILEKINHPARIREFEHIDSVTNETIFLSTGIRYAVLRIGNNCYFFNRLSGKFDGTGKFLENSGEAELGRWEKRS